MIDYTKAILSINKLSDFSLYNNDLQTIVWRSDFPMPSQEEIDAKIKELQAQYEANEYQRDRQTEYPSIQDQLDMQFWDKINGTNNWQKAIEAVKTKHPKPEA